MDDPYGSPDQKFDSEKSTKDDAALSHKIRGFPRLENLGGPVTAPMPWAVRSH